MLKTSCSQFDPQLPSSTLPRADVRDRICSRLLRRSSSLLRLGRGTSLGPADGSHLPAPSTSAEELIAAIGLEPRHAHSGRHLAPLQSPSRSTIASPPLTPLR